MVRAIGIALVLAVTALGTTACGGAPSDPFGAYRQMRAEEIPGAFDWALEPVDPTFRPSVAPDVAYGSVYDAGAHPRALAVLGRVRYLYDGTLGPPAWVFVTPHMCFATEKGDLVSPGRTGDGCEQANLYVQGVDATTGVSLGGFPAYMPVDGWTPAREGTPAPLATTTARGVTILR